MCVLFWISVGFILYVYFLYPAIIFFLGYFFPKKISANDDFLPKISVLIACRREIPLLLEKLQAFEGIDYPKENFEVLVGLDGVCLSDEERIAFEKVGKGFTLRVYEFPEQRGKPSVLNDLIDRAEGEVFVFTDARQKLSNDALRQMVVVLSDEGVGAVSGELVFLDDKGNIKADIGLYWRYEKFIRKYESQFFSLTGATGALYAMKREFVKKFPADIILDDVWQPANALRSRKRILFCDRAKIYDYVANDEKTEFKRKVRTLIGNFQLIFKDDFFLSFKNPVFWQFVSHKVLRLLVPYAMIICWVVSALECKLFVFFVLQTLGYIIVVLPMIFGQRPKLRVWSFFYVFCLMNLAAVVAMGRFFMGRYSIKWR